MKKPRRIASFIAVLPASALVACSAEIAPSSRSISKRGRISTWPPKKIGTSAIRKPAPWNIGVVATARSDGP